MLELNKEELKKSIEKLYVKNLTFAEIAKQLNYNTTGVRRIIKKLGISRDKTEYLTNKKFHKLTVVEYIDKKRYKGGGTYHIYKCKCECGNFCFKTSGNLKRGNSKSCEACENLNSHFSKIEGKIPSQIKLNINYRCKKNGLDFNLTDDFLWNLYLAQNKKCAISGIDINFGISSTKKYLITASLDRIDSSKGYIEGNVQWVHKRINAMKLDDSQEDFIKWCHIVSKNNL